MITLELNTEYSFVFESCLTNGSSIQISLSIIYGSKADFIKEFSGFEQHGLEIVGAKEIIYELDDELLAGFALTNFPISFYDTDGIITDLVISEYVNLANVVINVKINNIELFIGSIDPLSISYSKKDKILECSFKPGSYLLNETETWKNGEINYLPIGINIMNTPILITEFIERVYKIVKNDIQTDISQKWIYAAMDENADPPMLLQEGFNQIYVEEHLFGDYNGSFISNGINTYGKLIKYLAFTFGCVTGLISSKKAIFYPFFGNDKTNKIVDQIAILDFRIEGKRDKITYFEISNTGNSLGVPTTISGKYISKEILKSFYLKQLCYIKIATVKINNSWYNFGEAALQYWSKYLMSKSYMLYYYFELSGIDYNFTEDLILEGVRYTPIYMKVKLDTCTTEFRAVRL